MDDSSISITIQSEPISTLPSSPSVETGARVEFSGTIRGLENESPIKGLHYESYDEMAINIMKKLLETLRKDHPFEKATVMHRKGNVPVGEAAIYVCIESGHRKEAFEVCTKFMDQLKEHVPIWKTHSF